MVERGCKRTQSWPALVIPDCTEEQQSNFIINVCSFMSAEIIEAHYLLLLGVEWWTLVDSVLLTPFKVAHGVRSNVTCITLNFHCKRLHRGVALQECIQWAGVCITQPLAPDSQRCRRSKWNLAIAECKDHGCCGGCIIIIWLTCFKSSLKKSLHISSKRGDICWYKLFNESILAFQTNTTC